MQKKSEKILTSVGILCQKDFLVDEFLRAQVRASVANGANKSAALVKTGIRAYVEGLSPSDSLPLRKPEFLFTRDTCSSLNTGQRGKRRRRRRLFISYWKILLAYPYLRSRTTERPSSDVKLQSLRNYHCESMAFCRISFRKARFPFMHVF